MHGNEINKCTGMRLTWSVNEIAQMGMESLFRHFNHFSAGDPEERRESLYIALDQLVYN